jgi:anti-sigma B factor antagonist
MIKEDIVPGFDQGSRNGIEIRLQRIDAIDNCIVLTMIGYLDTCNWGHYQDCLSKTIQAGFIRLIFDCKGLQYVSSAADFFIGAQRQLKTMNGEVVLQGVHPKMLEVLQLLGLSNFFVFTVNLDESIAYFAKSPEFSAFPAIFACPVCTRRLKAFKASRYKCPECKAIMEIDGTARVWLKEREGTMK